MKKPKLIILEGVDKVGKSVVYQKLRRMTGYGPLVIDRFVGSNFAYDCFWKRNHYIEDYEKTEKHLKSGFDVYLIYLVCSGEEHKRRLQETENMESKPIKNIRKADSYFYLYYTLSSLEHKTTIDTTNISVEETVNKIINFTEGKEEINKISSEWIKEINKINMKDIIQCIRKWRKN